MWNKICLGTYFALSLIALGYTGAKHGTEQVEKYNVWATLMSTAINIVLMLGIYGIFG